MTDADNRELEALTAFAGELADVAARETLPLFRTPMGIDNKKKKRNYDPVTAADRGAERAMREHIAAHYPDHTVCGEELDDHIGTSAYKWLLDPIDGTKAYIVGIPVWSTLIALLRNDVAIVGIMDQPFTGERFIGTPQKSFSVGPGGETALKTRSITELGDAVLASSDPHNLADGAEADRFHALRAQVRLTRYGGDAYFYCLLAAGLIDIVIDPGMDAYDIAAHVPIIESAGGVVSTWDGSSPLGGGNIVATANGALHETVLACLTG